MRISWLAPLFLVLTGCRSASPPLAIDRLQPCKIGEGPSDAYCGKLKVFENRETRQGRKIDIKVVVMPALRRDPKPDPIFLFAGGPGQGAAKLASLLGTMFRRFQSDRDLVMIDQRGTGDSHPLNCDMEEKGKEKDDLHEMPPAEVDARFRACLAGYDADPAQYTTPVAMQDIDEVRRHLGYGEINVWGGSYGTRAALVYLRQFESTVRSVILDGVAPTNMRLPLYMARDSQRALDLLIAACEQNQPCRQLHPTLRETIRQVIARAESRPVIPVTHPRTGQRLNVPLSPEAVRFVIFGNLYNPMASALLPRLLSEAANGDFQGLWALGSLGEGSSTNTTATGMFLSVVCAEDMPSISREDIDREAARSFLGRSFFDLRMKPCEYWPKGKIDAAYHEPVASSKPTLILSGQADPVTPPAWGEAARQHLKNSRHIIVPGAGHGVSSIGCVPKLMAKFVDQASPAGLDEACVAAHHRPPFFLTSSGLEEARR